MIRQNPGLGGGVTAMNLATLQRCDPCIHSIIDSATQVALYDYDVRDNPAGTWCKTNVEGSLFIYSRTAHPIYGFLILNRLNTDNLVESISADLEVNMNLPYLFYKKRNGRIRGLWFYDHQECIRIAKTLNKLVVELQRQQGIRPHSVTNGDRPNQHSGAPARSDKGGRDIIQLLNNVASNEAPVATTAEQPKRSISVDHKVVRPLPIRQTSAKQQQAIPVAATHNATSNGGGPIPASVHSLFTHVQQVQNEGHAAKMGAVSVLSANELPHTSSSIDEDINVPPVLQKLFTPKDGFQGLRPGSFFSEPDGATLVTNSPPKTVNSSLEAQRLLERKLKQELSIDSNAWQGAYNPPTSTTAAPAAARKSASSSSLTPLTPGEGSAFAPRGSVVPGAGAFFETVPSDGLFNPNWADNLSTDDNAHEQRLFTLESSDSQDISSIADLTSEATDSLVLLTPNDILQSPARPLRTNSDISLGRVQNGGRTDKDATFWNGILPPQQMGLTPLTKDQLKQAMCYLLKNDPQFIARLHDAYVKSLNESLVQHASNF